MPRGYAPYGAGLRGDEAGGVFIVQIYSIFGIFLYDSQCLWYQNLKKERRKVGM